MSHSPINPFIPPLPPAKQEEGQNPKDQDNRRDRRGKEGASSMGSYNTQKGTSRRNPSQVVPAKKHSQHVGSPPFDPNDPDDPNNLDNDSFTSFDSPGGNVHTVDEGYETSGELNNYSDAGVDDLFLNSNSDYSQAKSLAMLLDMYEARRDQIAQEGPSKPIDMTLAVKRAYEMADEEEQKVLAEAKQDLKKAGVKGTDKMSEAEVWSRLAFSTSGKYQGHKGKVKDIKDTNLVNDIKKVYDDYTNIGAECSVTIQKIQRLVLEQGAGLLNKTSLPAIIVSLDDMGIFLNSIVGKTGQIQSQNAQQLLQTEQDKMQTQAKQNLTSQEEQIKASEDANKRIKESTIGKLIGKLLTDLVVLIIAIATIAVTVASGGAAAMVGFAGAFLLTSALISTYQTGVDVAQLIEFSKTGDTKKTGGLDLGHVVGEACYKIFGGNEKTWDTVGTVLVVIVSIALSLGAAGLAKTAGTLIKLLEAAATVTNATNIGVTTYLQYQSEKATKESYESQVELSEVNQELLQSQTLLNVRTQDFENLIDRVSQQEDAVAQMILLTGTSCQKAALRLSDLSIDNYKFS